MASPLYLPVLATPRIRPIFSKIPSINCQLEILHHCLKCRWKFVFFKWFFLSETNLQIFIALLTCILPGPRKTGPLCLYSPTRTGRFVWKLPGIVLVVQDQFDQCDGVFRIECKFPRRKTDTKCGCRHESLAAATCLPCWTITAAVLADSLTCMGGWRPDGSVEERMKYTYELRPVELVHFPQLKTLPVMLPAYAAPPPAAFALLSLAGHR